MVPLDEDFVAELKGVANELEVKLSTETVNSRSDIGNGLKALRKHGFNISRAANELGLTRASLYRRMEKHDI